jgi:hypothetical protein
MDSIRERALAAHEARQRKYADEAAVRRDKNGEVLQRLLKEIGIDAEPVGDTVEIDGLTFVWQGSLSHGSGIAIRYNCPDCGQVDYREIKSLADIGAFLQKPPTHYGCPATTKHVPTVGELLEELIRDIVREELEYLRLEE